MEKLLDEYVLAYKPKSYRIINSPVVYLGEDDRNNLDKIYIYCRGAYIAYLFGKPPNHSLFSGFYSKPQYHRLPCR